MIDASVRFTVKRKPSDRSLLRQARDRDRGGAVLQYVIAGLVLGGIYAIAASGLVVTYLSAGILNFASAPWPTSSPASTTS